MKRLAVVILFVLGLLAMAGFASGQESVGEAKSLSEPGLSAENPSSPEPAASVSQEADAKEGAGPEKPEGWFAEDRLPALVVIVAFTLLILLYIHMARKYAKSIFIRKIAGLDAVDEAVGRATEMGRPILYISGIGDMSMIATLASLSILRRVAERAAEYQARLLVPCCDPIVHSTAQETVKMASIEAGRPDAYNQDDVSYLTYDQFGYAAGVDGILMREKPGAVFLQGWFAAESLVMAETGNFIGAIQIAGTDQTSQLPFLVAACDYTLIGEELFAAACYLSRDPVQLGTLKSQDGFKALFLAAIAAGVALATLALFFKGGSVESAFHLFSALFPAAGGQ